MLDKLLGFVLSLANSSSVLTVLRYSTVMALTALAQSGLLAASPTDIQNIATQIVAVAVALYGAARRSPDELAKDVLADPRVRGLETSRGSFVTDPSRLSTALDKAAPRR